jgi:hypothetical protein
MLYKQSIEERPLENQVKFRRKESIKMDYSIPGIKSDLTIIKRDARELEDRINRFEKILSEVDNGKRRSLLHGELRRFEVTTTDDAKKERLETLIKSKNLTREDLALILFNLRIRPGFSRQDFGI